MSESFAPVYEIEFYEDDQGHEPALAFMQSLPGAKRRAIGVAINEYLRYLGPAVVRTDFGKSLGEGLYEFRVDQDAEQILRKAGKGPKARTGAREDTSAGFLPPVREQASLAPVRVRQGRALEQAPPERPD